MAAGRSKAPPQSRKESESARHALRGGSGQDAELGTGAPKPGSSAASRGDTLGRNGKESKSLHAGMPLYRSNVTQLSDSIESLDGAIQQKPLTPEQRRDALEQAKLSPALIAKLAAFRRAKSAKPEVVEVQVWVNALPSDGLTKLKSLVFTLC